MFDKKNLGVAMAAKRIKTTDSPPDVHTGEMDDLHEACVDLLSAIKRDDPAGMAKAWRAGFEILESEPHAEEGQE